MAELTPVVAFAAGLLSFFAPCIIPIVPAYVSYVTGGPRTHRLARSLRTGSFVSGFSLAFIALGLLVGAVGTSGVFQRYETWARWIGGSLIIAFGLSMTGLLRLSFLDRDVRFHRTPVELQKAPLVGAFALGTAFGIGWSPCVGPILASVLILAGTQSSTAAAGWLLGFYALGLAIPFLLVGFAADSAVKVLRRFARASHVFEVAGGALLVLLGIFVFTGATARLTSLLLPGGSNA